MANTFQINRELTKARRFHAAGEVEKAAVHARYAFQLAQQQRREIEQRFAKELEGVVGTMEEINAVLGGVVELAKEQGSGPRSRDL